jgi:hypothetical protein
VTAQPTREQLISELDRSVSDTLDYFANEGPQSNARVGDWSALQILAHFPYWHYATGWGITSVTLGGPPWQLSGTADETNAACLAMMTGDGFDGLIGLLRQANIRLVQAAQAAPNLDAIAFRTADAREVSVRSRLEIMARHWHSHLEQLRAASQPPR